MFTYVLIGLPFLALVLLLDLVIFKTKVILTKEFRLVLLAMVILTAVFDQFLTGLSIVEYDEAKTLGLKIGYAPIEDFMYTIVAVIGLGSLERHYGKRRT